MRDVLRAMEMRDVVLVHGLFHQPAHMDALVEALQQRGARVVVPRLHRGSLEADVRAVQAAADLCETPPILAGHSYGGAVIADVTRACSYVFFAAFAPVAGESCAELGGPDALVNKWVRPTFPAAPMSRCSSPGNYSTQTAHQRTRHGQSTYWCLKREVTAAASCDVRNGPEVLATTSCARTIAP